MSAIDTSIAISRLVKLGKIADFHDRRRSILPPHDFTFGWYPSIKGLEDEREIMEMISMYD